MAEDVIRFSFPHWNCGVFARTNLLPEDLWGVPMSTNDTQTTVVRHCSSQLWPAGDVHPYRHTYPY
jgi:hypothetical protein